MSTRGLNVARFMAGTPYWPVLSHPLLRRLLPGFVVSSLGDGMAVVAVSWLALELTPATNRGLWVAGAVAAYTLPGAAGALLLARFLRHRPPARLVGWDATLRACALGAIPVAYVVGELSIGLYIALLGISSVLHSWGQAGRYTLLARVLPERNHLAGNAVLSTIGAASTVIGPALAGVLIAWHGAVLVIALDAVTFVVLAATFHFFAGPEAETSDPRPEHNAAEPPTPGKVSVIRGNPTLMGLLALSFGFFFLFGPVYVALPLHVATDLHGSATLLAAFYTAFGVGALLGATLTGYLNRWPLWPSTIGIVVGFGAVMLLVGLGVPTPVALVSFALAGLLWPPYASMSTALFQHSTTSRLLPQLLAANSSVRVLSVPLGTALGGPLVGAVGAGPTLQLSAAAILALGLASASAMALWASRS